jgi:hypothetical protein
LYNSPATERSLTYFLTIIHFVFLKKNLARIKTGAIIKKTDKNCRTTINRKSQPVKSGFIKYPTTEDKNSPKAVHKMNNTIIKTCFIPLPL